MTSLIETLRSKAAEAREIADKATPGPWEYGFEDGSGKAKVDSWDSTDDQFFITRWNEEYDRQHPVFRGELFEGEPHDCEFIAASRTLIPELAQLLESAAGELEVYEGPRLTSAGATIKHYQTENARLKKALEKCKEQRDSFTSHFTPTSIAMDAELEAILGGDEGRKKVPTAAEYFSQYKNEEEGTDGEG